MRIFKIECLVFINVYQNSEKIFLYISDEILLKLWSYWRVIWISIRLSIWRDTEIEEERETEIEGEIETDLETQIKRHRRRERGNREVQRWEHSLKWFIYFTPRIYLKKIMRDADTGLYKSISLLGVIYNYEIITLTHRGRIIGHSIAVCPNYGIVY